MSDTIKIVILGAGYGGILTAKKLARRFKKIGKPVSLSIIDQNPYHTMLTELHEVAADRVPEEAIRISLKKIFAGRPVQVIQDRIEEIDFLNRQLKGQETYSYDYLVVGTGSRPTFFGVEGAEAHSFKLWSDDDAVRLRDQILQCFRAAVKTTDLEERRRLLTFVVVGSGFTGVEMIGELAEWIPKLCRLHEVEREEVRLIVADQLPRVLSIFPEALAEKAAQRLRRMRVEIRTGAAIESITDRSVTIAGEVVPAKTVVWAAGIEGSEVLGRADIEKAGRNRIVTNAYLQSIQDERVFVVGDNIFYIPEGEKAPIPQMVENAEHSAETVAHNLVAEIRGESKKPYKPAFHGAMVCVGGRWGLAHLGLPGKFFGLTGFFAMLIKHVINVIYFLQVAGFNKVWTYMLHEGFHVKDGRSFVGAHFSKASPNFWLLPLRLFVGWKWLTEGLDKLPKVLENPSGIFLIPPSPKLAVTAATQAAGGEGGAQSWTADAVTAATQAAGEAASQWGEALPVPDFVKQISDFMMELMFYQADGAYTGMATVFQTGMILAEIVVGALLLAGLFTAAASILSLVMGGMIYISGMAPTEMLWYWAAGIALIGGSGSVFGLDYYIYPPLKRWWRSLKLVKKYYLYTD